MLQRTLLGVMLCLWLSIPQPLFSTSSTEELESMKQEISELKKTIQDLKTVVEIQNQKIEGLQNQNTSVPKKRKKETHSVATSRIKQPDQTQNLGSKNPEPQTFETKSFGPIAYQVPSNSALRLLPDVSIIGVFSGAYFHHEPGEHHEEETSQEHEHEHSEFGHDPIRTGFNLQEVELAIQAAIDPYLRGDVFFSFSEEGVELEEAYVTTLGLGLPKGLQIRAGKYLQPFGRQNQKHLEARSFVNDHLIHQKILGGEGFNELGIELSYLFPTPFFLQGQFSFSQGENEGNFDGERKGDFAYTGRISTSMDLTENLTLLAGTSVAVGFNNSAEGNRTHILGGDLLLKWRPSKDRGFDWQTEYVYRRREVQDPNNPPLHLVESEGGMVSYLVGQWNPRFGAGLRAEYFGIPKNEEREGEGFRISPMLFYKPSEFFRLKLQYDYTQWEHQANNHAVFLQMIFNLGPHGAHNF